MGRDPAKLESLAGDPETRSFWGKGRSPFHAPPHQNKI